MTREDFVTVLQEFADSCNAEFLSHQQWWYELRDPRLPERQFLLRLGCTSVLVFEVHYRVLCGEITNRDVAFPMILRKNFGGVMATEFFFSVTQGKEKLYLFLESRVNIDPEYSKEDILGILATYWIYPLFTSRWEFPDGVTNYLWY
jgi:hypothetical protein